MVERRGRAAVAWALGLECAVLTGFLFVVSVGAPLARSQCGCRGDREPARPFRHGHAERDGAVADEERRIDQRDDHEHDANRHRRDRTWFRVARPPPRSGRCRRRCRLQRGLHASRGPVSGHARVSARDRGRHHRLCRRSEVGACWCRLRSCTAHSAGRARDAAPTSASPPRYCRHRPWSRRPWFSIPAPDAGMPAPRRRR